MDWIQDAIVIYLLLVVSLVCHEAAHAWLAYKLGDRTAYVGGQVTLNPIPHMQREPFGTIVLPVLVLVMSQGQAVIGFAHAPIDASWAHRHPRRAAAVSAAGPAANFLIVAVCGALYALVSTAGLFGIDVDMAIENLLLLLVWLNVFLGVLNLLPIPPLDGSGVLEGLFPRVFTPVYDLIRRLPFLPLVLLIALFYTGVLHDLYRPVLDLVKSIIGVP